MSVSLSAQWPATCGAYRLLCNVVSSDRVHCGSSSDVPAISVLPDEPLISAPACEIPASTAPWPEAAVRNDFSAASFEILSTLPPGMTIAEKSDGETLASGAFGTTG